MKNLKNILILSCLVMISACAGSAFDAEHRAKSTLNVLSGKCASGQYKLAFENPNTKQGWKLQKEYACTTFLEANGKKALSEKIYTKEELLQEAKDNEFVHTMVM